MNLRRTMVTAAAAAVIAPLALLSAPAAFAEEGGTSSPSASSSETGTSSPSASASDDQSASDTKTGTATDASSASSSPSDGEKASGSPSGSSSASSSSSGTSTASSSASESGDGFDPYEDCDSFDLDEDLSAQIKGLPSKIVAGSGWHGFTFVVDNDSDRDLKNVYIDAFLEYGDETTEAYLSEGLAVIQVKEDGKWTNSFQDSYEDEHGKTVNVTGSFVGLLDTLEKHSSASLELRVKVKASAPAGSSLALSEAVYAGEDSACYGNGDYYDVRILAAGKDAGDSGDAKPNGDKPTSGVKPQGDAKPISGSLASTGSDSALPVIGLVGGVAVLAGGGAVFAVRRRKVGMHA
ncbi:LPXTG cell wall anchor domain-containing protein [Streptomyces sp. NPDC054884]|uniref:LPXTG cell wall anchor domain-containing protein n=1 Tax=Streptomyces sp. ME08-AFT2 TaxID=3028683 RepID=UPI0029B0F676|nr:LPXTG cell wall anchor domain-containing protein [Streptomyces sp. ME08-AFT2]MDX3307765.1 LPXTG cell wall anchor domain-containing protein [Streptomyces sp. ME08-AFT2]